VHTYRIIPAIIRHILHFF